VSGARRPSAPPRPEVVYRGVRWRRSGSSGRVSWFNDGLGRWVVWAPGSDAPPLPPEYEASTSSRELTSGASRAAGASRASATPGAVGPAGTAGTGGTAGAPGAVLRGRPADAMSRRKPMSSPYRLVPLLVAVFVVAFALWQATRPPGRATHADITAAQAFRGQCLHRQGGTTSAPVYSPTPVSCGSLGASVTVVAVLVPGRPGSCPAGSAVVQVLQAGVAGEPSECVLPVRVK
jgi:hypothetical protein